MNSYVLNEAYIYTYIYIFIYLDVSEHNATLPGCSPCRVAQRFGSCVTLAPLQLRSVHQRIRLQMAAEPYPILNPADG